MPIISASLKKPIIQIFISRDDEGALCNYYAVIRNILRDNTIGSNSDVVANGYTANYFGAGPDVATPADFWSSLAFTARNAICADGHVLEYDRFLTDYSIARNENPKNAVREDGRSMKFGS